MMLRNLKFLIDGIVQGIVVWLVNILIVSNSDLLIHAAPIIIILTLISLIFSVFYYLIIYKETKLKRIVINSVFSFISCILCLIIIAIINISFDFSILTITNELNNAHGIMIIFVSILYLLITIFFRTLAIAIVFFRCKGQ